MEILSMHLRGKTQSVVYHLRSKVGSTMVVIYASHYFLFVNKQKFTVITRPSAEASRSALSGSLPGIQWST